MPVPEHRVQDVPELVTQTLAHTPLKQFWFRGQGCASRDLTPSLWRRLRTMPDGSPLTSARVLEVETRLITRFRQKSLPYWPAGYPQSDWEHLFAMQHFGLPTRLLDWSTNLLMSVFFAMQHDVKSCECGTEACLPTIWLLDPIQLNQSNPRLNGLNTAVLATSDNLIEQWTPGVSDTLFAPDPVALYGTYNSDRIAAQHGAFTVAGKRLEPLNRIESAHGSLRKFLITGDRARVNEQLRVLGITRSTVYPGLAELAHDITMEEI